jgi:2'-5' RNA ligase
MNQKRSTASHMHQLRLFISIDTPPDIKQQMGAVRDKFRAAGADARWETNDKLHCTLKFLGETNPDRIEGIVGAVQKIAGETPCFSVRYRTIGCFPTSRDPRVVWIGMENEDGTMQTLQRRIDEATTTLGFPREERSFHPHVTLGRVKSQKNIANLLTLMETVTFETEPAILRELKIIRSDLKPAGSVYTILKSIPLKT